MAFDDIQIQSTLNGVDNVIGFRADLAETDVVVLSLTSTAGILSRRWSVLGRPEFSTAGGAGANPWALGTGTTATFVVDSDAGDVSVDGTYIVECIINEGSPNETRKTVALCRDTGLVIAGPTGDLPLRKLGGMETFEDTSVTDLLAGWATQLNRWLEYIKSNSGGTPAIDEASFKRAVQSGVFVAAPSQATDDPTSIAASPVYVAGSSIYSANLQMTSSPYSNILAPTAADGKLIAMAQPLPAGALRHLFMIRHSGGVPPGARLRVGIYANVETPPSATLNLYPGELIYESGELNMDTVGLKGGFDLSVNIPTAGMYWMVCLGNALNNPVNVRLFNTSQCSAYLGFTVPDPAVAPEQINYNISGCFGWWHAQAYGAMPTTFPTSAPVRMVLPSATAVRPPAIFYSINPA